MTGKKTELYCTDARNADLIRAECGSECESIKSLSGGTMGHSRWQSTYAVGLFGQVH